MHGLFFIDIGLPSFKHVLIGKYVPVSVSQLKLFGKW